MKALNSFALLSLSSLAVAGVVQADEPIKVQPQQQPTIKAQTPQYQWVQSGRRQRWQLVNQNQASSLQTPTNTQQTTPSSAAQASPNTATSSAKITAVTQQPVVEVRKQGLLSRLRGKRSTYSSVISVTPTATVATSAAGQPLPNAK